MGHDFFFEVWPFQGGNKRSFLTSGFWKGQILTSLALPPGVKMCVGCQNVRQLILVCEVCPNFPKKIYFTTTPIQERKLSPPYGVIVFDFGALSRGGILFECLLIYVAIMLSCAILPSSEGMGPKIEDRYMPDSIYFYFNFMNNLICNADFYLIFLLTTALRCKIVVNIIKTYN